MTKRIQILLAFLVVLSVLLLGCGTDPNPSPNTPTPTPPPPCHEDKVQTSISWDGGIVLTLNHCLIKDLKVQAVTVAFISGLIAAICPNFICKAAVSGIAAFIETQIVLLGEADDTCNGNGAILEVGSFNDQTLWEVKNICNISPGHLVVTDNNPNGESNLRCFDPHHNTPINLSFTAQNTGQRSLKWHISIYFKNSKNHYHPYDLRVYLGVDNHSVSSGFDTNKYTEWGTTANHGTPVIIKGQVTPNEVRQYGKQIIIAFIAGSGSDRQNPPPIVLSCA